MLRKFVLGIAAAICVASTVGLSGCNTVAGAGKDIERGGEKVQDTAKDVQKKM